MIVVEEDILPIAEHNIPNKLTLLKEKINDEDYLFEAVQRIAQVLSNEISGSSGKNAGMLRKNTGISGKNAGRTTGKPN